jgi:predicted nucleic acid-binding protein
VILVDTSVWIDHLRGGDAVLVQLLEQRRVLTHPFVVGEVALGNLRERDEVLGALSNLPQIHVAAESEVLHLIDLETLFGRGIGYVDVHLLAGLRLTPGTRLWSRDRRLAEVADQLGLAASELR